MKKELLFAKGLLAAILIFVTACSCPTNNQSEDCTLAVLDNIATRVSVRQFTDRAIDKDVLEDIVRAGMAAPTAVNKQPWAFVVVTEREMLDSLNRVHPYAHLETATAAIIVCGDMEKALDGYAREYWIQDCSAATQNILLAAHAYGIGSVWCGVYPDPNRIPEVTRVLGLPGGIIPLNIITMGYPASEDLQPKDKWKPENIHYQRW
ncbi:MAG: nitroreductase family protein [Lentimicrobiaceae bacterium]|nr:nitroreductase family protein [Lentimicrobiaceae bacterium]